MIAAWTSPRRRARPSMPVMVAVVVVGFGALAAARLLATSGSAGTGGGSASDARALLAYDNAIYPATEQAGQAIVAGILPDIDDFRAGRISAAVWDNDMRARQAEFAAAKSVFDHAAAPASVRDAPGWFDRAFADYRQAVQLFADAGSVTGSARDGIIARGQTAGQDGDHAFDHGIALIQAARRALHLGPDARFSDPGTR